MYGMNNSVVSQHRLMSNLIEALQYREDCAWPTRDVAGWGGHNVKIDLASLQKLAHIFAISSP